MNTTSILLHPGPSPTISDLEKGPPGITTTKENAVIQKHL
jgi:hypothetical protein